MLLKRRSSLPMSFRVGLYTNVCSESGKSRGAFRAFPLEELVRGAIKYIHMYNQALRVVQ